MLQIVELERLNSEKIEKDCEKLATDLSLKSEDPGRSGLTSEEQGRLVSLLREQTGESDRLEVAKVAIIPGGLSKRTMVVDLKNATVLPAQIVLRQDFADSPLGSTVADEYPFLMLLHAEGVKVSAPLAHDWQGSVANAPMIVMNKMDGIVIGDGINLFEKEGRGGAVLASAREMAKFHMIAVERLPDSVPGKAQSNIDVVRADIDELKKNGTSALCPL